MIYNEYDQDTLQHLQKVELMILKDFIKICDENNLRYYMYGGSLLGTIRHNGFIPWDDDIDVIMPREDHEKFKEIFLKMNNEKYELLSCETQEEYFFLFFKIILKDTKFEAWWEKQVNFDEGIYIDVFAFDYLPANKIKRLYHIAICRTLDRLLTISAIKLENYPFLVQNLCNFLHVILKILHIKPSHISKKCVKLLKKYTDSELVCEIAALNHPQIYKNADFGKGIKVDFEDIQVNTPSNSDSILTNIYGDYMKLPPEEDRYNHAPENLDFGKY